MEVECGHRCRLLRARGKLEQDWGLSGTSAHLSVESAHPLPPWLSPEDVNPQRLAPAGTVLLQKVTITGSPPVLLTVVLLVDPGTQQTTSQFIL